MSDMPLKEYQAFIKEERKKAFPSPYDLVYSVFTQQGFDKKDSNYFKNNASYVVDTLRSGCWGAYIPEEKKFVSDMLLSLIDDTALQGITPKEAVIWFAETHPEHIYQLSLSNTQSRRSRAGKEFEAIIELILIGAGIPLDTQGNIGKKMFVEKGLGKLVDVVSPGVTEYEIDKNDVILISAKTTLRERWQEVPEEMGRTGAKEMFLATLDENISDEVLSALYESNIRVTTTHKIKQQQYSENKRVLDFERLIEICDQSLNQWNNYCYSQDEKNQKITAIYSQIEKHSNHSFIANYYYDKLNNIMSK